VKVSRYRTHKVNVQKWESIDFGARVEIDTETDPEFAGMEDQEIRDELDSMLDALLDKEADRVLALGGEAGESHIVDFYEI
jgi:hypothetical protein